MFYLSDTPPASCKDEILEVDGDVSIWVIPLNCVNHQLTDERLMLYGDNQGELLAFGFADSKDKYIISVVSAINWYSNNILGNPTMKVVIEDPRK